MAIVLFFVVLVLWTPIAYVHVKRGLDGTYARWSEEDATKKEENR